MSHKLDNPILYISYVENTLTRDQIRKIFDRLNMGVIYKIDKIQHPQNENMNRVFIHYKKWNDTENSIVTRKRLQNDQNIKVFYNEPYFWKITAYKKSNYIDFSKLKIICEIILKYDTNSADEQEILTSIINLTNNTIIFENDILNMEKRYVKQLCEILKKNMVKFTDDNLHLQYHLKQCISKLMQMISIV